MYESNPWAHSVGGPPAGFVGKPGKPAPVRPARPQLSTPSTPLSRRTRRAALLLSALLPALVTGCDAIYEDTKGWASRLEASILESAEGDAVPAPAQGPTTATIDRKSVV